MSSSSSDSESELEDLEPTIQNIIDQKSLKWIFVGGKGGVGKTTTSCSLAVALAAQRRSVLLISTDPAHNLSDAFAQKFTSAPTPVRGVANLFAMEIDPTVQAESDDPLGNNSNFLTEIANSVPGIDEAMSFAELMRQVQSMNYEVIVFDTAPTGHTLRLLSFPSVLQKGLDKFLEMKSRFSGIFSQVQGLLGQGNQLGPDFSNQVMAKLEQVQDTVQLINRQFQDPEKTTFVCVCIPEFLSVFETERLVQELAKFGIDSHNIVVNQVLMTAPDSKCGKCAARVRMQRKYLGQIDALYDEYHVTKMPLLDAEVRGIQGLQQFCSLLLSENLRSQPGKACEKAREKAPEKSAASEKMSSP